MLQPILFAVFIVLIIIGSKLKKSFKQDFIYSLAFTFLLILIISTFTNQIEIWLFCSLWLIPLGLSSSLKEKHANLYKFFSSLGSIWFLLFLGFIAYLAFLAKPIFSFSFVCFFLLIIVIYRSVFAPSEKLKNLLKISVFIRRVKSRIAFSLLLSLLIPVLIFVISNIIDLTFEPQIIISLYSIILEVISTLLGIIVTIAIFLLSSVKGKPSYDILIRGIKGLTILYTITLLISMIGLMSVPSESLHIKFIETSFKTAFRETIFIFIIGLFISSIVYLIVLFIEIIKEKG